MAITYTWEINEVGCERDISDGYFTTVVYRVMGLNDGEEKARRTGQVEFTKPSSLPSDFIAYDESAKTPNEETMVGWVKDSLGSSRVSLIEDEIKNEIDLKNTPVKATGCAW